MNITYNKISYNEIIEVFSNLQLRQNTLVMVISVAAVADPGCLFQIPDPESKRFRIPNLD
jgi:hypothetical protein